MITTEYLNERMIRTGLSAHANHSWQQLDVLESVGSTNQWLLEQAKGKAICVAETQTAGRGRRGRVWQSPVAQNIYLSVTWDFEAIPQYASWISLVAGIAVVEALQVLGMSGQKIKWPNDVYHQQRKMGGILLQSTNNLKRFVIGIGLNVNMQHDESGLIDQAWCSVADVMGEPVSRNQYIASILNHLHHYLERFPYMTLDELQQAWQPWDLLYHRSVRVQEDQHTLNGVAQGVNEQGCLNVCIAPNTIQSFSSADVSVRL